MRGDSRCRQKERGDEGGRRPGRGEAPEESLKLSRRGMREDEMCGKC